MYVCLMDPAGKKLVHTNIKNNDFAYFLKLIEPYRHSLTVCCECMFGWYWLADACLQAGLTFVLAHLLRANLIPPAYVYPAALRPLRALWRQRLCYVWRRAELLCRIQSHELAHIGPLAQRLEAKFGGNKFKANTVLAIKLARAVYFMLKTKTVFDSQRLIAALARN